MGSQCCENTCVNSNNIQKNIKFKKVKRNIFTPVRQENIKIITEGIETKDKHKYNYLTKSESIFPNNIISYQVSDVPKYLNTINVENSYNLKIENQNENQNIQNNYSFDTDINLFNQNQNEINIVSN